MAMGKKWYERDVVIYIIYALMFGLIMLASSCSTEKKAARKAAWLEENAPSAMTDTIHDTISVIIPEVKTDTFIFLDSLKDTVIITKDRLEIKTVYKDNEIYIEGKCSSDTVYKEVKIPYEKIVIQKPTWWQNNRIWVVPALLVLLYAYLRKKIPFLP